MEKLRENYVNGEKFFAEDMNKMTHIINKLDEESIKIKVLDELPETGEESIMYFVPSSSTDQNGVPVFSAWLYDNGVPTLDWEKSTSDESSAITHYLTESELAVGDVFKYVHSGETVIANSIAAPWGVMDESGNTIFAIIGGAEGGLFNIGDTIRATNPYSSPPIVVFTEVNNPSIVIGKYVTLLNGVVSYSVIEANKIYRLTGYHKATIQSETESSENLFQGHEAFFMTFEEALDVETPDYEFQDIGAVQIRPREYIVPSEIDKDNLKYIVGTDDEQSYPACKVVSGVTSTITLQDGHYYKLKDRYFFKAGQLGGLYPIEMLGSGYGCEIFVFEEVTNPDFVKFDEMPIVPAGQVYQEYEYCDGDKFFFPMVTTGLTEYGVDSELNSDFFPQIKKGDIVKVTGENILHDDEENVFAVIEEVDDESLEFDDKITGILNASIWAKDECYRLTGYHHVRYKYEDEMNGMKFYIPTFEKVSSAETVDYEVEIIPGFCVGSELPTNTKEEWMWIDGAWELIGATKVDLSNYVTKDELEDELYDKADKSSVPTKTSQLTNDSDFAKVVTLTKAEYDALATKDPKTLYIITQQ